MTRKFVIQIILAGAMGALLAAAGVSGWYFWAALVIYLAHGVNEGGK